MLLQQTKVTLIRTQHLRLFSNNLAHHYPKRKLLQCMSGDICFETVFRELNTLTVELSIPE